MVTFSSPALFAISGVREALVICRIGVDLLARSCHGATAHPNKRMPNQLFIFGGIKRGVVTSELVLVDLRRGSAQLCTIGGCGPAARSHCTLTVLQPGPRSKINGDCLIYLYGGHGQDRQPVPEDQVLWLLRLDKGAWIQTPYAPFPPPPRLYLHCAANHSNEIWIAGVTGSLEAMLTLRVVNKEGSVKWVVTEEPAAVEAGRAGASMFHHDKHLYIFGGLHAERTGVVATYLGPWRIFAQSVVHLSSQIARVIELAPLDVRTPEQKNNPLLPYDDCFPPELPAGPQPPAPPPGPPPLPQHGLGGRRSGTGGSGPGLASVPSSGLAAAPSGGPPLQPPLPPSGGVPRAPTSAEGSSLAPSTASRQPGPLSLPPTTASASSLAGGLQPPPGGTPPRFAESGSSAGGMSSRSPSTPPVQDAQLLPIPPQPPAVPLRPASPMTDSPPQRRSPALILAEHRCQALQQQLLRLKEALKRAEERGDAAQARLNLEEQRRLQQLWEDFGLMQEQFENLSLEPLPDADSPDRGDPNYHRELERRERMGWVRPDQAMEED